MVRILRDLTALMRTNSPLPGQKTAAKLEQIFNDILAQIISGDPETKSLSENQRNVE